MNENLAWLTKKSEDLKSNKGNVTFPTHSKCDWTVKKLKVATLPPISTSTTTLFRFIPFLAKHFSPPPQVTQFLEGPNPPVIRMVGGVPTMMLLFIMLLFNDFIFNSPICFIIAEKLFQFHPTWSLIMTESYKSYKASQVPHFCKKVQ